MPYPRTVISSGPRGTNDANKLKIKHQLQISFEEKKARFDMGFPGLQDVECAVTRVGYITLDGGRLAFPTKEEVKKFVYKRPEIPFRMNHFKYDMAYPRITWPIMESILGNFDLKVSVFDFIGSSTALKRIGYMSNSLHSVFYRICGHSAVFCDSADFYQTVNLGDYNHQFQRACTPNAPPSMTLHLATINEFRISAEKRFTALAIHEVSALDINLNPIELKSTQFQKVSLSMELKCAYADIKRTYVANSLVKNMPRCMIVNDIEKKKMTITKEVTYSYWRMVGVFEYISHVIKSKTSHHRFHLLSIDGKFVFGSDKVNILQPLRLTAETIQLFPSVPDANKTARQKFKSRKPKRKRRREPIEKSIKIDYFPDEKPLPVSEKKKRRLENMNWMDKLPTKNLWDGEKRK